MDAIIFNLLKYIIAFFVVLILFFINIGMFIRMKITPLLFEKIFKCKDLDETELETIENFLKEEIKMTDNEFGLFLINMVIVGLILIIVIKFFIYLLATLISLIFKIAVKNSSFYSLIFSSFTFAWLLLIVFSVLLYILKEQTKPLVEKFINNTRNQYLTILRECKKKKEKQTIKS